MDLKKKLSVVAWNVGFIETCIEDFLSEPESYRIVWMKHSYRDRFFADPFLFDQDSNYYYILAEEYVFALLAKQWVKVDGICIRPLLCIIYDLSKVKGTIT